MRNKLTSRMLAALLAVVMVVGLLPMTALAARVIDDDAPMAEAAMGEEAVTAPVRAPSKAAVAAAEEETPAVEYEYVLDTDGIDDGAVYVIYSNYDQTKDRLLYYSGSGELTDMLPATLSGDTLGLNTDSRYPANTQLWEAEAVEGGIALKSLAADMYLKVQSSSTHAHIDVSDTPQALTITANSASAGRYKVVQNGWSLNWSGSGFQTHNADNNYYVRFFKQTPVVTEPETPEEPETPVEKPRHYFAKAAAGANPWTIISDGTGLPNTLSYYVSATSYPEVTTLDASKPHRIYASSEGASGNGFLNVTSIDKGEALVATPGVGHPSNTMVTFEAQDNGAYLLSVVKDSTTYYLTATTKTYNGKECAVFSPEENDAVPYDAVPYFVEYDEGFRIFCVGPYTVSFDSEGAADIEDVEAMYGQKLALPTPTREGYTFQGWFVGEEEFTAETEVTADVTLTAQWEEAETPVVPDPVEQTYASPAEAVEEGKIVTYLAFTGGTNTNRWWDAASTAGNTTHIQLYNAAGTAAGSATTLDTDGITAGNYVINFDTGDSDKQAVMHYSDGVTNQCSAVSVTCGNNGDPLHLFVFEKAEDNTAINAFTIKAYNTTKYLSLEASGSQRAFKDDKTVFYVTPVNEPNDGTYYIWTAVDPEPGPTTETTPLIFLSPDNVAEGYEAKYLSFGSTGWNMSSAAYAVKLYELVDPEGTVTSNSALQAATAPVLEGRYAIARSGNQHLMHFTAHGASNHTEYTNQCGFSNSKLGGCAEGHLATFEAVAGKENAYRIHGVLDTGNNHYVSTELDPAAVNGNNGSPIEELKLTAEGAEFFVSPVAGQLGSYYIWIAVEVEPDVITPPVEPEGDVTMAQTKFSGTSDKPMDRLHILDQDDDVDTDCRIPALTTLDNGWIVAACDIRWSNTEDSPNNLDTIVSISKNGGERWEWEVVNYFSDFAPINGSRKEGSASFIDPAVVQSEEDGSIYLLVDAQPPYVNGGKIGNGFDDQGRLKISKSPVNGNYAMDNGHDNNLHGYTFNYYVNINNAEAGANYAVDGKTVKLWPICANADDQATGYYVDAFFNTYYDYGEGVMKAVIAQQHDSTAYIHNNIFYTQSEWKVFPTAFLMVRKATVNEATGKLDWGEPRLISSQVKHDNEHFIGVCPGRGFTTTVNGKERILFALYDNATGTEKASVIYSDDGGVTWNRGARVENGETTGNSESQIVELHDVDGNSFLRMFSRNPDSGQYVSYADSIDNGLTWTATKFDRNMPNGYGTMMSFIGLEGFLVSPEGDVYEDVVLASYPRGDGTGAADKRRTNGIVRIGYYDAENEVMVWLNGEDAIRYPYKFTYSCLTQLRDGDGFTDRFALLYEDERTWTNDGHGMEMGFDTFTSADLLGEGWMLVQTKPDDDHPIITVAPIAEQTYTGESIEPAVTVKKNGEVMTEGYTVEYSNNTEAGEATVTVTVGEIVVETTFWIVKPDEYTVGSIADRVYTGGAIEPTVVVRKNGKILSASYYTLEYEKNVDVGTATVKVVVGGEVVATGTFQIVADTTTEEPGKEPEEPGEEPGDDPSTPSTPSTPNIPSPSGNRYTTSNEEDLEDLDVPLASLPTTFVDVRMSDWFCAAAEFVFAKNLMQGVSATEFRPEMNTTRGMVVTILHRMEQEPQADPAAFVDVAGSAWYADAVAWGAANNVVKGVDDGGFHPTDDVTREQLAAFLYRFAEYRGYDVTARGDLSAFADGESISGWAADAMSWAVGTGLITGKSGDVLDPLGTATRAELAAVLTRFCQTMAGEK